MRKEKKEFDEMTAEALKRAKKEIIKIEKENDERFSSEYLVFLKKKEEINRKLESIKSRYADKPEVIENAEKSAKKAMDELIEKNDTSKANHEVIK